MIFCEMFVFSIRSTLILNDVLVSETASHPSSNGFYVSCQNEACARV